MRVSTKKVRPGEVRVYWGRLPHDAPDMQRVNAIGPVGRSWRGPRGQIPSGYREIVGCNCRVVGIGWGWNSSCPTCGDRRALKHGD